MSNVIQLNVPSRRQSRESRFAALLAGFAECRRFGDDVFWLKENAELLNILECTGARLDADILAPHAQFYEELERRLGFFPQYYRFLLSICLDLEDLGLPGGKSEALCHWAARKGLAEAELSDLQRAEARRLMLRRDIDPLPFDTGLNDRLHAFIDRSETFAMPNKKAAYELTHIVFYLSEYGRRDPGLSASAFKSLENAGLLAYLDQNVDLLSEVCVATRYAGQEPPEIWESWIARELRSFSVLTDSRATVNDDYHDYFVANWAMAVRGREPFAQPVLPERMSFHRAPPDAAPLRTLSQYLFELDDRRSDDWHGMRDVILGQLGEDGADILEQAEASTGRFDEFFAGFARTGPNGSAR